jgi:2-amino-4-hydroxy-6-hydroxymethyldihydropteridine diphosphokinase
MQAYVGLGGNVGEGEVVVRRFSAVWRALAARPGTRSLRGASVYRSRPVGAVLDQADFFNTVFVLEIEPIPPEIFLAELLALEHTFGRDRTTGPAGGPRTLDLDLLAMDDLVVRSPRLVLPHPRAGERDFVRVPLAEIGGPHRLGRRGAEAEGRSLSSEGRPAQGDLTLYCAPRWPLRRDD